MQMQCNKDQISAGNTQCFFLNLSVVKFSVGFLGSSSLSDVTRPSYLTLKGNRNLSQVISQKHQIHPYTCCAPVPRGGGGGGTVTQDEIMLMTHGSILSSYA